MRTEMLPRTRSDVAEFPRICLRANDRDDGPQWCGGHIADNDAGDHTEEQDL